MPQKFSLFRLGCLLCAIAFWACNKEVQLSLKNNKVFDTELSLSKGIDVQSQSLESEKIQRITSTYIAVGDKKEKRFGRTRTSALLRFALPDGESSFEFDGTNLVVDSAVLVLTKSSQFYGDSLSKYVFRVRKMNQKVGAYDDYPSDYKFDVSLDEIGTLTKTWIKANDTIEYNKFSSAREYTITKVPSEYRIKLDKDEILNTFVNAPDYVYKSESTLNDYFNGYFLDIDESQSSGDGGILYFDVSSSRLEIYYRATTGDSDTVSTTYVSLGVLSSGSFAGIQVAEHDYEGTDIKAQLASPSTTYSETFLVPFSGLDLELDLSNYDFLKDPDVIIQKATIDLFPVLTSEITSLTIPSRIGLYYYDNARQKALIIDNQDSSSSGDLRSLGTSYGGYFNSDEDKYSFIITGFLEDLLEDKIENKKLYVTIPPESTSLTQYYSTFRSDQAVSFHNSGDKKIKISVYYTKVNSPK